MGKRHSILGQFFPGMFFLWEKRNSVLGWFFLLEETFYTGTGVPMGNNGPELFLPRKNSMPGPFLRVVICSQRPPIDVRTLGTNDNSAFLDRWLVYATIPIPLGLIS